MQLIHQGPPVGGRSKTLQVCSGSLKWLRGDGQTIVNSRPSPRLVLQYLANSSFLRQSIHQQRHNSHIGHGVLVAAPCSVTCCFPRYTPAYHQRSLSVNKNGKGQEKSAHQKILRKHTEHCRFPHLFRRHDANETSSRSGGLESHLPFCNLSST